MASIGNSLSSITNDPTTSSSSSSASAASAADPTDALGNENTFLQLLVAQLQNQDPSQPQDGTQFVTQLAQFSDLEQNIGMKTDLDSIASKYTGSNSTDTTSTSSTTSTGAASGTAATTQGTQSGTTGTQQVQ